MAIHERPRQRVDQEEKTLMPPLTADEIKLVREFSEHRDSHAGVADAPPFPRMEDFRSMRATRPNRVYYLTWQACAFVATITVGNIAQWIVGFWREPNFTDGICIGVLMMVVWYGTMWKDGDR